jgi:3-hydroxymyristoyl/3-hydroxydecanoyl-(acyl carrier protein) dehydratase
MSDTHNQPKVLDQAIGELTARLALSVGATSRCFDGHFPGHPIVPGVMQVHWAMRFAREALGVEADFAGIEALKFQKAIPPDAALSLELKLVPEKMKLHFEYKLGKDRASSGRILLR